MPPNPQLPQRYHLRSRLRKTRTCPSDPSTPEPIPFAQSPPSRPYQSSGHMQQDRLKNKSKRSPSRSPPPSKGENTNSKPTNSDSEKGMSGRGQISIGSEWRPTKELTELLLACRASFQMAPASSTFECRLEVGPPKPAMSADPPKIPQSLKEPWGGLATTSTITSSMLARTYPPGMSALPQRVHYLVGSEPCSTQLILDSEPSLLELKTSTIGDSQPTSFDIAAQRSEFVPSQTPERTLKRDWQGLKKTSTSSPFGSAMPVAQSDWPPSNTSRVFLTARS